MSRQFKTLKVLQEADVSAPRPLLLDVERLYFESPSLLMTYLGRPLVKPRNVDAWLAGLANALVLVHQVTPTHFDLSHLGSFHKDDLFQRIEREPRSEIAHDDLAQEVALVLKTRFAAVSWREQSLIHRDSWPGNTVWHRGRLAGIVDWPNAEVGDSRVDVAQCRVDLAMMHGLRWRRGS